MVSQSAESKSSTERHVSTGIQPGLAKNDRKSPSSYDTTSNTSKPVGHDRASVPPLPPSTRSRPSSRESTKSASSSVSRKPAPPVPQKPILLSRPAAQDPEKRSRSFSREGQDPASSTATRPLPTSDAGIAPLTRQRKGKTSAVHDRETTQQRPSGDSGPPLPPRKGPHTQRPTGLMDDDVDGARGIPSLQPQRQP